MTKSQRVAAFSLLAVVAMPGLASAQTAAPATTAQTGGAAGSLPNTFDAPKAAAPIAPASPSAPSSPAVVADAETALKTTIAAVQNGAPNYDDMSPALATQVRERAAQITPLVQGFGVLQSVTHAGTENGAELFMVVFDKAATQWIIAQDTDHKIRALLFRPAPEATVSTPAT